MSKKIVFNLKTKGFSEYTEDFSSATIRTGFLDFGKKIRLADLYLNLLTQNNTDKYQVTLKSINGDFFSAETSYRKLNLPKGLKTRYLMVCLNLPYNSKLSEIKLNIIYPKKNV